MNFDLSISPPLYEMGYWVGTIRRWYKEGLLRVEGIPDNLGSGDGIHGSFLGEPKCTDPDRIVDFDKGAEKFPVESWVFPKFKPQILKRLGKRLIIIDEMGIKQKVSSELDSIPQFYKWPVENRDDWEKFRDERLNPKTPGRYPDNLSKMIQHFENRDYPLYVGGHDSPGFFGPVRYLMGEIKVLTGYYDDPQLIKDIINYLVDFWIQLWDPILSELEVDWVYIWEDMCYKTGPLISPDIFGEFMLPAYKKFTGFLKDNNIKNIILDTDGNVWRLIPLLLEGGVTGLFPMEVAAGMDVVKIRKEFANLQIMGGLDKRKLAKGKIAIDEELISKVPWMLKQGGYIPFIDHHIPPDVSLENFIYYRKRLSELTKKVKQELYEF